MADASLIFRIYADAKGVKAGVEDARQQLDKLKDSAAGVSAKMLGAFPSSIGIEAKKIGGAVGSLVSSFGGLGGAAAALGIGALANDFLDTTSSLVDLSTQTDITIRDLQRFKYAGDQVGVSLETITTAVSKLQNRLGSGDKSAFSALETLGITIQQLQRLDPGQQFEIIASGLSKITDANKRAALAQDLFDRGFVTLMPLLRSNIKEVGDQASLMSDAVVKAGDKFGDTWARISTFGKAVVAEGVFGPMVKWADDLSEAFANLGRNIDVARGKMDTLPALPTSGFGGKGGPPDITMSMADADKLAADLDRQVKAQLDAATRAAKAVSDAWKGEVKAIADAISGASVVREMKQWVEALRAPGAVVKTLADEDLRGRLGPALDTLTAKFGSLKAAGVGALTPIHASLKALDETAETIPPKITEMMDGFELAGTTSRDWAAANRETTDSLMHLVESGARLPEITEAQRRKFLETNEATVTWQKSLSSLSQAMTDLAQTAGSSFISAMASVVNTINVATKSVTSLKLGFADLTSGKGLASILSGLTGIVGGIGGIVSAAQAAISIGKALFSVFDRDKGRDLVVKFADSLGGFDVLQKQLEGLGSEGDRLWKLLTQGGDVHGSPDAARRAIQQVEEALKGVSKTIREDVDAVLDGIDQRTIVIPVRFDVEDVPSFGSGGIVRSPTLALVGESGPEAIVPLGGGGSFGGSAPIVVQTYLDGYQIAEATVPHIPSVLGRRG